MTIFKRFLLLGLMVLTTMTLEAATINVGINECFYVPDETAALYNKHFPNGTYTTWMRILSGNRILWQEHLDSVVFHKGFFDVVLGRKTNLNQSVLYEPTLNLTVTIEDNANNTNYTSTFSLTSVPFAIKALYSEEAIAVSADAITGAFTSTFNVTRNAYIDVQNRLFYVNALNAESGSSNVGSKQGIFGRGFVGIGITPNYTLDVVGQINAQEFLEKGYPLQLVFAWKQKAADPLTGSKNIYYINSEPIGISTSYPKFDLHVAGTINASEYTYWNETTQQSTPLSRSLDWKRTLTQEAGVSPSIYFEDGNVGLSLVNPLFLLDVNGSLRVGNTTANQTGTIRFSTTNQIEGYTGSRWEVLHGVKGSGEASRLAFWSGSNNPNIDNQASYSSRLSAYSTYLANGQPQLNIGAQTSDAVLGIAQDMASDPLLDIQHGTEHILYVSRTGNVGVGTSDPKQKLEIRGSIDATEFLLSGRPLRLALSSGDLWRLNADDSIYYSLGNVGIGRPDPGPSEQPTGNQYWRNMLELAACNKDPDGVTNDPAITFHNRGLDGSEGVKYTMGVDADTPDRFRIEMGGQLGGDTPLMVIKKEFLGIGLHDAQANLHISGNSGVVVAGSYTSTASVALEGMGTRLFFYPPKGIFRAGSLDSASSFSGVEWDAANLGEDSIGLGRNNRIKGTLSVVGGGEKNVVDGAYAVIPGGVSNNARGDFSMAMGRGALANHHGAFVFADTRAATTNPTQLENQFIIYAYSGVGINTNQTKFQYEDTYSLLTVKSLTATMDVFSGKMLGTTQNRVVINPNGQLGIAVTQSINAGLSVLHGKTGINTTDPLAALAIDVSPNLNASENGIIVYDVKDKTATPALVVTTSKNIVAIGMYPNTAFLGESPAMPMSGFLQVASGNVSAEFYEYPSGERISTDPPKLYWKVDTPNIYFVSGNVGVGTNYPRSLLELSDFGSQQFLQSIITFDTNNIDRYSMGISNADPEGFRIAPYQQFSGNRPPFVVKEGRVGIRIQEPSANLHVGGTCIVNGIVRVNTANYTFGSKTVSVNAETINLSKIYVNGNEMSAGGVKWFTYPVDNPTRIWYDNVISYDDEGNPLTKVYIGISTSNPRYDLEVVGTMSITVNPSSMGLFINKGLRVENILKLPHVNLQEGESGTSKFYVSHGSLYLDGDIQLNVSDVFSLGDPASGNVVVWKNNPTSNIPEIVETNMHWNQLTTKLSGAYEISLTPSIKEAIQIANTIQIVPTGQTNGIVLSSRINRDNDEDTRSFSANKMALVIDTAEALQNKTIRGLDINVSQPAGIVFSKQGSTVGLNVDVQNVKLISSEGGTAGSAYSAVFVGATGNVGIGLFPSAALDVLGTVSANRFTIASKLSVTSINVQSAIDATSEHILLGMSTSNAAMDINGTIQTTEFKTHGISSLVMNIQSGKLVVHADKKVGIEITEPEAEFEFKKTFSEIPTDSFNVQRIQCTMNATDFSKNITGLDIQMRSATADPYHNYLGDESTSQTTLTATGIAIDFSGLTMGQDPDQVIGSEYIKAVGLNIQLPSNNEITKNSAIFLGGPVGIGTTTPTSPYKLEVNGTVFATNAPGINLQNQQNAASFNALELTNTANENLIVYGKMTTRELQANTISFNREETENLLTRLQLQGHINQPALTLLLSGSLGLSSAYGVIATIDAAAVSDTNHMRASYASFNALSIGTTLPYSGMAIAGIVSANTMTVSDYLFMIPGAAGQGTVRINNNALAISSASKIGIGTSAPNSYFKLQINAQPTPSAASPSLYQADNHNLWQALRIQSQTTSENYGAGISFVTISDDTTVKSNQGAHMIALRAGASPATGSHLVFYTDPTNDEDFSAIGDPAERIRITASGNIGIGTQVPSYNLHINGTGLIGGATTFVNGLQARRINGISEIKLYANLIMVPSADITGLLTQDSLYLKPTADMANLSNYGGLYVEAGSNSLNYTTTFQNQTVTGNIRYQIYANDLAVFPYYSSRYELTGTNMMRFVTTNQTNTVTWVPSDNVTLTSGDSHVLVQTYIPTTSVGSSFQASNVQMGFLKRQTEHDSLFTGVSINMTGAIQDDSNAKAAGLMVNMQITSNMRLESGQPVNVSNIAALFLANNEAEDTYQLAKSTINIGIATSWNREIFLPSANVHIFAGRTDGHPALRIETVDQGTALSVSSNATIGIGTHNGTAKVNIKSIESGMAFNVFNSSIASLFAVFDNGRLGIGNANPEYTLDVAQSVLGKKLSAGELRPTSLSVNTPNNGLVIKDTGYIGIGRTEAADSSQLTQLDIYKEFEDSSNTDAYSIRRHDILLSSGEITQNLTGLDMLITANAYSIFGDGATSPEAYGIWADLTSLVITANAKMIGLDVHVRGTDTVSGNAGIFFGNVGINTTQPQTELEVSGTIKATAADVTNVELSSLQNARFSGNLKILENAIFNRLATTQNNSHIEIITTGQIAGNYDTHIYFSTPNRTLMSVTGSIIISDVATFNKMQVATTNRTYDLAIIGNAYFHPAVTINQSLTLSTFNHATTVNVVGDINAPKLEDVERALWVSNNLLSAQLDVAKTLPLTATGNYNVLQVRTDSNLYYDYNRNNQTASFNLSLQISNSGAATQIPYYRADGTLAQSNYLKWVTENVAEETARKLIIGTSETPVIASYVQRLEITGNATVGTTPFSAHQVAVEFSARRVDSAETITGMHIKLIGDLKADTETAIGLQSDTSGVSANAYTQRQTPNPQIGYKASAVFLCASSEVESASSGNVGIQIGNNDDTVIAPEASLHIKSTRTDIYNRLPALRIDTLRQDTEVIITTNSTAKAVMGIGTANPYARLALKAGVSTTNFAIYDSSQTPLWVIKADKRIGIGTSNPAATFNLLSASTTVPLWLMEGTKIAHVLDASGRLGIGIATASAMLSIQATDNEVCALLTIGKILTGEHADESVTNAISVTHNGRINIGDLSFESIAGIGLFNNSDIFSGNTSEDAKTGQTRFIAKNSGSPTISMGLKYYTTDKYDPVIHYAQTTTHNLTFLYGSTGTELMRLTVQNVGIGTTAPSANLHLQQTSGLNNIFVVSTSATEKLWVMNSSGKIGIHCTPFAAAALAVSGNTKINAIQNNTLTGTRVVVKPNLKLLNDKHGQATCSYINPKVNFDWAGYNTNTLTANAESIIMDLNNAEEMTHLMMGLNILMQTAPAKNFQGTAKGLYVNVMAVSTKDPNAISGEIGDRGTVIAAQILGGPVGIGTSMPSGTFETRSTTQNMLLHVYPMSESREQGTEEAPLIGRYGNTAPTADPIVLFESASENTGEDYPDYKPRFSMGYSKFVDGYHYFCMSAYQIEGETITTKSILWMHLADDDTNAGSRTPNIGIGVTFNSRIADCTLQTSGDIRVGTVSNNYNEEAGLVTVGNIGGKVWFSGGPRLFEDTDNADDLWIARFNVMDLVDEAAVYGQAVSEIRVNIGDRHTEKPNASFVIGTSNSDTNAWYPLLTVWTGGYAKSETEAQIELEGMVGIGTTRPQGNLHVKTISVADLLIPTACMLTNTSNLGATNNLLLAFTNNANPENRSYFMTFLVTTYNHSSPEEIGGVRTDGIVGSEFYSLGADYAEYLTKATAAETIKPGDIVGIMNGKVTRDTRHAQHILAASSGAIIAGNWQQKEFNQTLIAFMGQVKVPIRGPVKAGDWIVPSGFNDGTGRAVSEASLTPQELNQILGQALESKSDAKINRTNILIGTSAQRTPLLNRLAALKQMENEVQEIRTENSLLKQEYALILKQRQKQIAQLQSLVYQ